MKYQLVVDTHNYKDKENRFKSIDFDGESFYSLEDIDLFTTKFQDENDLKDYLKDFCLINPEFLNKTIRIIDENGHVIRNGVAYRLDKKFLNIPIIYNYFVDHKDDKSLIQTLYYAFQKNIGPYGILFSLSCELYNYLYAPFYDPYDNRSIENIIYEYIYYLCSSKYGYINTHKLGMIIAKNERKKANYHTISYEKHEKQKIDEDYIRLKHIRSLIDAGLSEEELTYLLKEEEKLTSKLGLEYNDEESSSTKHTRWKT